MKMLEGLTFRKRTISHLGCVKGCLDYLGVDMSWPRLYGGTGHAFIINIHGDVDLESVTAWNSSMLLDLAPNLGYRVGGFAVNKEEAGESYPSLQKEAWDLVRDWIEHGTPCYGWELKAPYGDFWVITGYDEQGYHYSGKPEVPRRGRNSGISSFLTWRSTVWSSAIPHPRTRSCATP